MRDEKDHLSQLLHVLLQTNAIQSSPRLFYYYYLFYAVSIYGFPLLSLDTWALAAFLAICIPKLQFFLAHLSDPHFGNSPQFE